MMRMVYIVTGDVPAHKAMAGTLRKSGFSACVCGSQDEFLEKSGLVRPDLLLLGSGAGEVSSAGKGRRAGKGSMTAAGLVRHIRSECRAGTAGYFPVILVAPDASAEEILGAFGDGVDDFITNPYHAGELLARVRLLLEGRKPAPPQVLELGAVRLDAGTHEVFSEGVKVYLTAREYRLLLFFMQNPGIVLNREEMMYRICGKADPDRVKGRSVDMTVCTLRRKLGAQGSRIESVRAAGYLMRADGEVPCREE